MTLSRGLHAVRIFLFAVLGFFIVSCTYFKTELKEAPFDPESEYQKAEDLMNRGYHEEARKVLEDIRVKDTSQQYSVLSRLRIADTYFEDGAYEEGIIEYQSFIESYPAHKYAPYAQYRIAMSYFKQIKTPDISFSVARSAMEEFERLQRNYPRNPYMEITENRINACLRVLAEYEFYVGDFYFKKGAYMAAAERFNTLLKNYPDSVKESEALYYLGISYEELGERERAISALTTLIEKFPTIKLSSDARNYMSSWKENK